MITITIIRTIILHLVLEELRHDVLGGLHDPTVDTGSHLGHRPLALRHYVGVVLLDAVHLPVLLVLLQLDPRQLAGLQLLLGRGKLVPQPGLLLAQPLHLGRGVGTEAGTVAVSCPRCAHAHRPASLAL